MCDADAATCADACADACGNACTDVRILRVALRCTRFILEPLGYGL